MQGHDDEFGERPSHPGVLEAENAALIAIFALLVFFVTMTGLVVYSLCGGRESSAAAAAAAAAEESGSTVGGAGGGVVSAEWR